MKTPSLLAPSTENLAKTQQGPLRKNGLAELAPPFCGSDTLSSEGGAPRRRGFAKVVSILVGVVLLTACETAKESKYEGIRVSPTYAKASLNGSVQLTASGGYNYRWSLADATYGSLSSTVGESVTYTARKRPAANTEFAQTITVTGRLSNYASSMGATNTALYTAEAIVSHNPESEEQEPEVIPDVVIPGVVITSSSATAKIGSPVTLTATGGDGVHYTWSIANGQLGTLSGNKGRQITYLAYDFPNATQTIKVTSAGKVYQIAMVQVP